MEGLDQDLRFAARTLAARPGLTLAAVATLAVGIGSNAAMFTFVNAVLFRTAPVAEPRRLAFVFTGSEDQPHGGSSYPDYLDYRDRARAFEGLAAYGRTSLSLSGSFGAEQVPAAVVSGGFFEVLGVRAGRGRVLSPADDRVPGGHPVAMIGDGLWRRRFGGDPGMVGREIRLNGHPFTVVGVAPPGFRGAELLEVDEVWVPLAMQAVTRPPRAGFSGEMDPDLLSRRQARWLQVVGRLRPGVRVEEADSEFRVLARRLAEEHPDTNRARTASAFPLSRLHPAAYPILLRVAGLLLAGAAMVLLVACFNVGNLLLARALGRQREIAVRLALGASRLRLVRQLLVEGALLAVAGGALGLVLGRWAVDVLRGSVPPVGIFSFTLDTPLDARVLGFTLGLALLTVLLFALAPALQATRPDVFPTLKDAGVPAGSSGVRRGLREALVVGQVALSLVLLAGAGLLLRSAAKAQGLDPGYDAERVLVGRLDVDLLRYTTARGRAFYEEVVTRVAALPGVDSVSLARTVPLEGSGRRVRLDLEGRPWPQAREEDAPGEMVGANVVHRHYFRTLGILLLRGRDFGEQDKEGAPLVAIVTESFARRFHRGEAIGERISVDGPQGPWREIVGVVRDSRHRRLTEEATAFVYLPLAQQHETGMALHVRVAGETGAGDRADVASAVRTVVRSLEPDLPLGDLRPLWGLLRSSLFPARMGALIFAVLGAATLSLAAIGLYGVLAYLVARRTREIGIRVALGARSRDVVRLVMGEGMALVGFGLGLGLVGAVGLGRLIQSFLFGVGAADPPTFAGILLAVGCAGLLACGSPLRRALRLDPAAALRHE
jgi:predicted permease